MRFEAAHITVHTAGEVEGILSAALDLTATTERGDVSADAFFAEASRLLSVRASVVQPVQDGPVDLGALGINTRHRN